jgi:predicted small secreted protein
MHKALLLLCMMLVGCDTMAGFGEDMQNAGSNLSRNATERKYGSQPYPPPPPPAYAPAPYTPGYQMEEP